jgi:hypothetical protein
MRKRHHSPSQEVAVTAAELLHHLFPWEIAPGVPRGDDEPVETGETTAP